MSPCPKVLPGLTVASLKRLSDETNRLSLSDDATELLVEDLNYRLLHMLSVAFCLRNESDRSYLSVDDVDLASRRFFLKSVNGRGGVGGQDGADAPTKQQSEGIPLRCYRKAQRENVAGAPQRTYVEINPWSLLPPTDRCYDEYVECMRTIIDDDEGDVTALAVVVDDLRKTPNVSVLIPKVLNELRAFVASKELDLRQCWSVLAVFHALNDNPNVVFGTKSNAAAFYVLLKLLTRQTALSADEHFFYVTQVSLVLRRVLENSERHNAGFSELVSELMLKQLSSAPASHVLPYLTALRISNCESKIVERLDATSDAVDRAFTSEEAASGNRADRLSTARELLRQAAVNIVERARYARSSQLCRKIDYASLEQRFGEQIVAMLRPIVVQCIDSPPSQSSPPLPVKRSSKTYPPGAIELERRRRLAADQEQLRKRLALFHLFNPHMKVVDVCDVFDAAQPVGRTITFAFGKNLFQPLPTKQPTRYRLEYLWNKPQHTFRIIVKHMPMRRMREQSFRRALTSASVFTTF